jgi:PhoPQ-activated pathogenicity-related protein
MTTMRTARSSRRTALAALTLIASLFVASVAAPARADDGETALDRYVAAPDPAYRWRLVSTKDEDFYSTLTVELVSQSWRTAEEVDRTEWTHWLAVVRPEHVRYTTALLWIGGGANGDEPREPSERAVRFALDTGSVVAELGMVPNQPLRFADSPDQARYEDDLIAYGRAKSIVTGDDEWLARLPMVKSGVRAMDALQELLASEEGGEVEIESFVVAGGSKRGWTTWLVGVVDPRVEAIMPIVIDALNTEAITRRHFAAYGFFSPALGDYVRHGLYPHQLGTDTFRHILEIEDPYLYRHRPRMRIPKYVVNAAGDQYFLPDNSRLYFQAMPDEKVLRYVPNAKHDLAGSDAQESMLAFYRAALEDRPLPRYSWSIDEGGTIEVTAHHPPIEVSLWQATNPDARDFRLDTIGAAWTRTPLAPHHPGTWVASAAPPRDGFIAYFVELVFDLGGSAPLKATTDVVVLPDVLPFSIEEHEGPWLGTH